MKNTAFVLPFGHYQLTRLPQGWKNSPAKFQRIMCNILEDLIAPGQVQVYIDDILCGGTTEEENWSITKKVLGRLEEHGMKINMNKCSFNVKSVVILGRRIDGDTKTTKMESVEKVKAMNRPANVHEVKRFTGLTGYFRHFIPKYGEIVRPLDQLKKKKTRSSIGRQSVRQHSIN